MDLYLLDKKRETKVIVSKLNKIFSVIGALVVPLLLSGCGDESQVPSKDQKVLLMITSADYPPFESYVTGDEGQNIVGYDIDLAQKIGEHLGYKIEVKDQDYSTLIPAIQNNRADFAMAGIQPLAERKKKIDFSEEYYFPQNVLMLSKTSVYVSGENFDNIRVAVQLGSLQEQFAKKWAQPYKDVEIIAYNRVGDIVQDVLAGRVDGAMLDDVPAQIYHKKYSDKFQIRILASQENLGFAIAFPKGSKLVDEFNKALAHLHSTGYMDQLANKWLMNKEG